MGDPPSVVDLLAGYGRLVEVGVGRRVDVAAGLAERGREVVATDVRDYEVPAEVQFARDDVTNPDETVYANADAVYALNCPPELHRSLVAVAEAVDAACLFTTLGGDQPAVSVERRTVDTGTVFVARERGDA